MTIAIPAALEATFSLSRSSVPSQPDQSPVPVEPQYLFYLLFFHQLLLLKVLTNEVTIAAIEIPNCSKQISQHTHKDRPLGSSHRYQNFTTRFNFRIFF